MQNIPDNKLDDFFREKSDNARIAFNPEAWRKMQQKLDVTYSKRSILKRFFLFSSLFLLMVISVTTWRALSGEEFFNDSKQGASGGKENVSSEKSFAVSEVVGDKTLIEIGNRKKNSTGKSKEGITSQVKQKEEVRALTRASVNSKEETSKNNAIEQKITKIAASDITSSNLVTENAKGRNRKALTRSLGDSKNIEISNSYRPENDNEPSQLDMLTDSSAPSLQLPYSFVFNTINKKGIKSESFLLPLRNLAFKHPISDEPLKEDEQDKEIIPAQKVKTASDKIRVSFQFSPDVSSALGIHFGRTGYNLGATAEFFLLKNVSITASLLKARKVYTSSPDCYEFPKGYGHEPEEIDGECTVWDLPVNVRYFYYSSKKIRAFVSGGVSSYIMRKESYKYDYDTYSKTYDYPKGNNHPFSVINFSIGGEYRLGRRFSLGVEPFIKVPTKGVGEGKIKLNTVGAFLSINYNLF